MHTDVLHQTRKTTLATGSPTNTRAIRCEKFNPKGNDNKASKMRKKNNAGKISGGDTASAGTRFRAEMTRNSLACGYVQPHRIDFDATVASVGDRIGRQCAVSIRSGARDMDRTK